MMRFPRIVVIAVAALVAACGGDAGTAPDWVTGETWNVERVEKLPPQEDAYLEALRVGYVRLAREELAEFDWPTGGDFIRRAGEAGTGGRPMPYNPEDYSFPGDAGDGLDKAYRQITAYITNEGAMLRAARQIGEAQVHFDCWLREATEGHQTEDIAACREAFGLMVTLIRDLAALPPNLAVVLPEEEGNEIGGIQLDQDGKTITLDRAFAAAGHGAAFGDLPVTEGEIRDAFAGALAAQPKPPREFQLTFAFNSSLISDEAFEAILAAAAEARTREAAEVIVTGYADAVGDRVSNVGVSRQRAVRVGDAIFNELRDEENVSFTVEAKGARDFVEDVRGKAEANRRVVILVR